MNDNDIMRMAEIVADDEGCDFDDEGMKDWCGDFDSCMECKSTIIHALLSMLRDGPLNATKPSDAVYTVQRYDYGSYSPGKDTPSALLGIFRDFDEAATYVRSKAMVFSPCIAEGNEEEITYSYGHGGQPVAKVEFPQYVVTARDVGEAE